MTFAKKFCAQRKIPDEKFEETVFLLSIGPITRMLRPLLNLRSDYFSSDRDFIGCVGRISRLEDFSSDASNFLNNPDGRDFLHRKLGLRVSHHRLRKLVDTTLVGSKAVRS